MRRGIKLRVKRFKNDGTVQTKRRTRRRLLLFVFLVSAEVQASGGLALPNLFQTQRRRRETLPSSVASSSALGFNVSSMSRADKSDTVSKHDATSGINNKPTGSADDSASGMRRSPASTWWRDGQLTPRPGKRAGRPNLTRRRLNLKTSKKEMLMIICLAVAANVLRAAGFASSHATPPYSAKWNS